MPSTATILIVDDNELNMKMATDLLEFAGFELLGAEDAAVGIQIAKERHPDLILMDMHMPMFDGYTATRKLKADPQTAAIPVLAFTALAMEEEQRKALEAGCSGVICKPIDVDTFAGTVASYLLRAEGAEAGPMKSPVVASIVSDRLATEKQPTQNGTIPQAEGTTPLALIFPESQLGLEQQEYEAFISRVSHDLQSPLRKIRQFTSFLKEGAKGELSPENYGLLEALERSANQMHVLLSDLLSLARIEEVESNLTDCALLTVISEALQKNHAAIDAQKVKIELGEMTTIQANYHQLVQMFSQLIENSLKYHAKERSLRIYIGCTVQPEEGTVQITVQDNGIGFRQEFAEQIFQPLQRLHGVSKYPGSGIGLAIVKKIVERHHGSIRVASGPDQGTTFIVNLPLKQNQLPISGPALG